MKLKRLTADEVTFTLQIEEEDIPVRGNAMATDEPEKDKEAEDAIIERLNGGDLWAWCYVKVTARWETWSADAGLGGCSYENEEDFRKPGGYFESMCDEALAGLNEQIADDYKKLCGRSASSLTTKRKRSKKTS